MKQAALRAQIRQLCCFGLPAASLMPRLLPLVRRLVPADSAGFFWVDSVGDMQNLFAERMLSSEKMQLYFERFYDSDRQGELPSFRKQFLSRAVAAEGVTSSSADAALQRTAYYNEILRDLDAHHVLYGVVREHGAALGQISLYRARKANAFDAKDRADLASVLRYIAHAVAVPAGIAEPKPSNGSGEPTTARISQHVDTDDEAVAIFRGDGTVVHASELAKRLLIQAADGEFSPSRLRASNDAVARLANELVNLLNAVGNAPPLIVRDTRWGRLQVRAYRLDEGRERLNADTPIAIRVVRQESMLLRFAEAMRAVGLPPQQQEIATLLAHGKTNLEIGEALGVSTNTVSYHVKQLFARLDAHSRDDVVARILDRDGARNIRA
jgi:DNA-binding CsgD family transcriptional regulator